MSMKVEFLSRFVSMPSGSGHNRSNQLGVDLPQSAASGCE